MNIILINVSFENGTCEVSGINLITGDYNSTVCKFTFDKEDGTKIFKMKNPNDETVFEREIVDNEVVLTGYDEHDEPASIFNSEGDYNFEVNLYDNDGRLTSSKGIISVEEELVKEDDKEIEVYKPLFDQLMGQLNDAINETNNLDIDGEKVDTTTTITITKKDGTQESVEILDGEKGDTGNDGRDGITPNIQVGNTTTLPAGSNATVTQRGTTENPIFDFGIPKGEDGQGGGAVTSVNGQTGDVVINIPDTSGLGASIELSINSSTYIMTLNLKNENGIVLSAGTVDLPLESVVVNGTYDNTNKKIILTLQNGNTIDVPVGDSVSGLQETLVSGTNIKTINNQSILGSGNIEVASSIDIDETSITLNNDDELQAEGLIDQNTSNTNKMWTGTLAQYNALATKDSDTFYYITDDDATSTLRQKVEVITSSATSYTIANLTANKSYKLSELTALTITACETFDEESVIYFDSGSTATVLSLPNDVITIGDEVEANKSYIISVLNKIAVIKGYEVS
jgi:hypothetical protein